MILLMLNNGKLSEYLMWLCFYIKRLGEREEKSFMQRVIESGMISLSFSSISYFLFPVFSFFLI